MVTDHSDVGNSSVETPSPQMTHGCAEMTIKTNQDHTIQESKCAPFTGYQHTGRLGGCIAAVYYTQLRTHDTNENRG